MATLPTILQPGVIQKTISQLNVINDRLQNFFYGGSTADQQHGRYFNWDIFNETRKIAQGRVPDTGPGTAPPQQVKHVNGVFPRSHESIQLSSEKINNLRQIGSMEPDRGGKNYILRQEGHLNQKFVNARELQLMGMIRGSYFYTQNGDDINASLTGGAQEIDFQVPAGNKGTLDMLGAGAILGDWSDPAVDIPAQLSLINAAFESLTGMQLKHIWLTSADMNKVLQNDEIRALAGTANVVQSSISRSDATNDIEIVLTGLPLYVWHSTDGVLEVDGSNVGLVDAGKALFCPNPNDSWIQKIDGSEIVTENYGSEPTNRFGSYFHARPTIEPSGFKLIGTENTIPGLYIPSNIAYGTIDPSP